jgi:hypothetical protein
MASKAENLIKRVYQDEDLMEARERNCDKHTVTTAVYYTGQIRGQQKRIDITAALIRVLAHQTDGECATEGATDASFITPSGMILRFTSNEKRDEFLRRIPRYLSTDSRSFIRHDTPPPKPAARPSAAKPAGRKP